MYNSLEVPHDGIKIDKCLLVKQGILVVKCVINYEVDWHYIKKSLFKYLLNLKCLESVFERVVPVQSFNIVINIIIWKPKPYYFMIATKHMKLQVILFWK